MQQPLQITFRHTPCLPAVEARVRQRADELDRFFERIVSCRVVVECRHPRQRQGNLFHVRIDLKVPGREIVVGRDPAANRGDEDIYVAIRGAFDAAQRLLQDHARQVRGDVKLHAVPDHGRIVRLLPEKNCGFILAADGNELYFHRNSVANGGFDKLVVGDEVRFVAQHSESPEGPQASTVVPLGKHHLTPVETVRA
jgi:cold shock CspA family protein/ribosome-associated translation inhibitor RaiA